MVDRISVAGKPHFSMDYAIPKTEKGLVVGWIQNADEVRSKFHEEAEGFMNLIRSNGRWLPRNRRPTPLTLAAFGGAEKLRIQPLSL